MSVSSSVHLTFHSITIATLTISDDPTQANPVDTIVERLEAETGRTVEVTDVPDYLSVVEAVRADHVDIGIMSGFPSALAANTGQVDALLARKGDDEPVSTCVVKSDSPVRTVEQLRGKTVAFADPASSSGYFMPVYMLHQSGLEQGKDYMSFFSGGHEGSFAALEQGLICGIRLNCWKTCPTSKRRVRSSPRARLVTSCPATRTDPPEMGRNRSDSASAWICPIRTRRVVPPSRRATGRGRRHPAQAGRRTPHGDRGR